MRIKADLVSEMISKDLETAIGTVTIPGVIFDVSPEVYKDLLVGNKRVTINHFNIKNARKLNPKPYRLGNIAAKYKRMVEGRIYG